METIELKTWAEVRQAVENAEEWQDNHEMRKAMLALPIVEWILAQEQGTIYNRDVHTAASRLAGLPEMSYAEYREQGEGGALGWLVYFAQTYAHRLKDERANKKPFTTALIKEAAIKGWKFRIRGQVCTPVLLDKRWVVRKYRCRNRFYTPDPSCMVSVIES